jgi:hypothetical protein
LVPEWGGVSFFGVDDRLKGRYDLSLRLEGLVILSSTKTFTLLDNLLGWPRAKQQQAPSPTKPSNCDDHQLSVSLDMGK